MSILKSSFGNAVEVVPFLPMPLAGIACVSLTRAALDMLCWLLGMEGYPLDEYSNILIGIIGRVIETRIMPKFTLLVSHSPKIYLGLPGRFLNQKEVSSQKSRSPSLRLKRKSY
jgi:hypothetical protein